MTKTYKINTDLKQKEKVKISNLGFSISYCPGSESSCDKTFNVQRESDLDQVCIYGYMYIYMVFDDVYFYAVKRERERDA